MKDIEATIHSLLRLAPHARVLRHTPGNIRLQISMTGLGLLNMQEIKSLGDKLEGILSITPRLLSRSVDIEYDPDRLPYDFWESLITAGSNPQEREHVMESIRGILA